MSLRRSPNRSTVAIGGFRGRESPAEQRVPAGAGRIEDAGFYMMAGFLTALALGDPRIHGVLVKSPDTPLPKCGDEACSRIFRYGEGVEA